LWDLGAKPRHVSFFVHVVQGLGAISAGTKQCYLGASEDGVKPWVQIPKSYYQKYNCENLSKKGRKTKKDG
jgi:hypothetical protein